MSCVEGAEAAPAPAALLQQIRSLVDGCYGSMLRYASRRARQQAAVGGAGQVSADATAAAGDEATSTPAAAAAAGGQQGAQGQEPLSLEGMRALLLQQVPSAVADLRRQHVAAAEPEERRRLAHRLLLELLLRLCICGYGELAPTFTAWCSSSTSLGHVMPTSWRHLALHLHAPAQH